MQYSPKLKIAMDEIKNVLKKHDIAGFVVIHTPGFSEYLNHFSPSYSCAKMETDQIRFKIVSAEVGIEKAKQLATDTLNMMAHFSNAIGPSALAIMDAHKMLNDRYGGDDLPGTHTSHDQQNN